MRTIKFRGKRIDNGEWAYGYYYQTQKGESQILQTKDPVGTWFVDPETVGQFTGMKNKNGEDIHEGDVVKFNVEFCIDIVKIGNIHDNPELV